MKRVLSVMCGVMGAALIALPAFGTALTADRDTPAHGGSRYSFTQGSNVIYAGSMVAMTTNGVVQAADDAAGLNVIGCAAEYSDNTGANYSSSTAIEVLVGVFRWENGSSITDANVGDLAYVLDDQTVKTTGITNYIIAGVIVDYDSDGVWVDTGDIGAQSAATPASLAVSGNATVGGTLGVTGASSLSSLATTAGITDTDANGASVISGIGYEANDATLVLDADQGDDANDTWTIESEAADNDLSFVNGANEQMKISAAGTLTVTNGLTVQGNGSVAGTLGVTGATTLGGSLTTPNLIVLGSTTGTLDIVETAAGTNSLVLIIGTTTNIISENVQ